MKCLILMLLTCVTVAFVASPTEANPVKEKVKMETCVDVDINVVNAAVTELTEGYISPYIVYSNIIATAETNLGIIFNLKKTNTIDKYRTSMCGWSGGVYYCCTGGGGLPVRFAPAPPPPPATR